MKAMYRSDDRIYDLKKKIQDPGYLEMAISEMAQRLAKDLFPRIYSNQTSQSYTEINEVPSESPSFH